MAETLRILISISRFVLLGCYIMTTYKSIEDQPLPLLISSFLFLYLVTIAKVIVRSLKALEDLYSNMLNFSCYGILLFLHLLFCINISKSSALKGLLDIQLGSTFFGTQLIIQIIQCVSPFWYLLEKSRLNSALLLTTLIVCGLESLMVACILCKKLNKVLTVAE